ncbi:MAG: prohibitin family protein [Alphaproteobacteria bacterium]|nr:prohibitin family protein [Alphaproteobacteria bacterium]
MSSPWNTPSGSGRLPNMNVNFDKLPKGAVGAGMGAVALLMILFSAAYTIDEGERGVILRLGKIVGEAGPGLHFKLPVINSIEKISVQIQKEAFEKTEAGDNRLQAYSRDQQPATIGMAVNYHVTDASAVYAQYGSLINMKSRIINSRAYEQVKNVFGQFDAADAIQKRALLNAEVFAAIRKSVSGPLVVDSVQIEDVTFSTQYESAVEARMQAIVKQQQAEADKQKRIIDADASAYEVKAAADAKAHQIEVQGKAEAGAIQARGDALRNNPSLPTLVASEKWNGVLPTTMVPGNVLPFLNIK